MEVLNLLKEKRFFSKLSKNSRKEIDRLKKLTSEKIVEDLIREKLKQV